MAAPVDGLRAPEWPRRDASPSIGRGRLAGRLAGCALARLLGLLGLALGLLGLALGRTLCARARPGDMSACQDVSAPRLRLGASEGSAAHLCCAYWCPSASASGLAGSGRAARTPGAARGRGRGTASRHSHRSARRGRSSHRSSQRASCSTAGSDPCAREDTNAVSRAGAHDEWSMQAAIGGARDAKGRARAHL